MRQRGEKKRSALFSRRRGHNYGVFQQEAPFAVFSWMPPAHISNQVRDRTVWEGVYY
jgi:hypothetical protein